MAGTLGNKSILRKMKSQDANEGETKALHRGGCDRFLYPDKIATIFLAHPVHPFIVSRIGGDYRGFLCVEGKAASGWPIWPCFFLF